MTYSILTTPKKRTLYRVAWRSPAWSKQSGNSRIYVQRAAAERLYRRFRANGYDVVFQVATVSDWTVERRHVEDEW